MILYFSATGNCKYVASRIALSLQEEIISIVDCVNNRQYSFCDTCTGIVSPTYFWGLPSIVKEFLEKSSFDTKYLYFIATCGTTAGACGYMANKAVKERNIDAYYSVKTVDTYTPIFDLSTPEKTGLFTKTTEEEINDIIKKIAERYTNKKMPHSTPMFTTKLFTYPLYNKKIRKTSAFHVEESCIGCGKCETICPVQAIKIKDKKPVWIKEKCVMCLGCLHRCPKFAIQYGKNTKKHGQYINKNVKL